MFIITHPLNLSKYNGIPIPTFYERYLQGWTRSWKTKKKKKCVYWHRFNYSQSVSPFRATIWHKKSYYPHTVTTFKHVLLIVGSLTYAYNSSELKNMYYLPNLSYTEHRSSQQIIISREMGKGILLLWLYYPMLFLGTREQRRHRS